MSSRFKSEWGQGLGDWCRQAKQRASAGGLASRPRKGKSESGLIPDGKSGILIPLRSGDRQGGVDSSLEIRDEGSGSLGQHASPAKVWDAVVKMLTAIVSYVHIDDVMFDEVLDLLSDVLERDQEAREALEAINADAVWLARYERGRIEPVAAPKLDGVAFAEMMPMRRG